MNDATRKALELARNWFDDDKNKIRVSDVLAAIDAALAPAAPVAPDRDAFEEWARLHGGFDLLRTGSLGVTDGGWHFATYRSHATEAAWRAWANRPAPAAPVATAGTELARFLALAEAAGFKSIHDVPGLIDALRAAAPAAPVAQPLTDEQIDAARKQQ